MMICIKIYFCIWPGVMVSDRRDWISLKFIWHMTSNKTGRVQNGRLCANLDRSVCQFGQECLTLVHDVLVLFMFFLMADLY